MREKIRKLLRDPVGVLRRRTRLLYLLLRYRGMRGGRAEAFWSHRHTKYGADDLRGVGMESWSNEENQRDYQAAAKAVLGVCAEEGLQLAQVRALDVGCGVGFYAESLQQAEVASYTGVDIAPVLFPELRRRFPGFQFKQADISRESPGGIHDLILMIDVTQHLVADEDFARAMGHLRSCLAPGGLLLVTSWLRGPERLSFYEVARPLAAYQEQFPAPAFQIRDPRPFRRKHLLVIRKSAADKEDRASL